MFVFLSGLISLCNLFGLNGKFSTCEIGISDDVLRQVFDEDADKIKAFLELRDLVLAHPFAARNKPVSGDASIVYLDDMFVGGDKPAIKCCGQWFW